MAARIRPIRATAAPTGAITVRSGRPINVPAVNLNPLARALENVAVIENQIERAERATKVRAGGIQARQRLAEFEASLMDDPDLEAHPEKFNQFRESVRTEAEQSFGDDVQAFSVWQQDFDQAALRTEVEIRTRAARERRARHEGRLEFELLNYADAAATARDPDEVERLKAEGGIAIADALDKGVISPLEAVKRQRAFQSNIVSAQVREDIRRDPEAAEQALLSGGYRDLQGEERTRMTEMASRRVQRINDEAWRAEERSYRLADRQRRIINDETQRNGDELLASGELTREWVEANRGNMESADYRYYLRSLSEESAEATENETYSTLLTDVANGDDVTERARDALTSGLLTRGSYNQVLSAQKNADQKGPTQNFYKRGLAQLRAQLQPGEGVDDPVARFRYGNAAEDWNVYVENNPKATRDEMEQELESIIREYNPLNDPRVLETVKRPRWGVYVDGQLDLDATREETMNALLAKHGGDAQAAYDDPQAREQARLIELWRAKIEQQQRRREARGR